MRCHSCDLTVPADATAINICDDCLYECMCWECRVSRHEIDEDRREQADVDFYREQL